MYFATIRHSLKRDDSTGDVPKPELVAVRSPRVSKGFISLTVPSLTVGLLTRLYDEYQRTAKK